ncbi:helix-turn-helix domain-containing protein [Leuconostoc mesenteroides]|uniref:helix-turn-helix domain-containing protein n=1 Tax=Leuconostoc mesenteroides TaxID=1245 RepID=UPI000E09305F|nr:helix-turn-helix transcriptional regulator [Leuconostoc mesenteroides]RDF92554.1 XRE family transcriptional regulator [Leuconostoc mesenteroides subsp. mesenteroides]WMS40702.1 helix-turn-helix transcriptional regulator [Leuconostoc mesenteroides]
MNKLKEIRLQSKENLTLDDVASATGINRATLSRYENGNTEPKIGALKKLSEFYGVSVTELMGVDDIYQQISGLADTFRKSNDRMLKTQLNRISNTKLRDFESLTIAYSIQMVLNLYDRYDDDSDELGDITVILYALNNMINNTIDDDNDYQDTIETFTKLVKSLEAQNKKASDD